MCQMWKKSRKQHKQLIHNHTTISFYISYSIDCLLEHILRTFGKVVQFFLELPQHHQIPDHVPNVEAISQTAQSANPQAHDG